MSATPDMGLRDPQPGASPTEGVAIARLAGLEAHGQPVRTLRRGPVREQPGIDNMPGRALLEKRSVVVIGPGLGQEPETQQFALELIRRCGEQEKPIPMVLEEHDRSRFGTGRRCRRRQFHTVPATTRTWARYLPSRLDCRTKCST